MDGVRASYDVGSTLVNTEILGNCLFTSSWFLFGLVLGCFKLFDCTCETWKGLEPRFCERYMFIMNTIHIYEGNLYYNMQIWAGCGGTLF